MKKTILILAIIAIYSSVWSQNLKYIPDPNLDKFVGTWLYKENGKNVEIILRKIKVDLKDISTDVIEGYHIYSVNGNKIENSLERNHVSLKNGSRFFNYDPKNTNQITISLFDSIKKKSGEVTLTFISGNPNKIQWGLRNTEGLRVHNKNHPEFDKTFTLPETMVFYKEK